MGKNKYTYNIDFFKSYSNQMFYVLGLLYSDGNLHKEGRSFSISCQKSDAEHLENISLILKSTKSLFYSRRELAILFINNSKMYKDLLNWGLYPNKSNTLKPHPDLAYNRHFWRGCIDGDGCVSANDKILKFYGTEEMVKGIIEFVQLFNIQTKASFVKQNQSPNFGSVTFSQHNPSNIIDLFYGNLKQSDLVLKRKYESYLQIKSYQQEKIEKSKLFLYDINGNYIRTFSDIHEICDYFKIGPRSIHRHMKDKTSFVKGKIVSKIYSENKEEIASMYYHLKGWKHTNERKF